MKQYLLMMQQGGHMNAENGTELEFYLTMGMVLGEVEIEFSYN